jgi:hypothetical protein
VPTLGLLSWGDAGAAVQTVAEAPARAVAAVGDAVKRGAAAVKDAVTQKALQPVADWFGSLLGWVKWILVGLAAALALYLFFAVASFVPRRRRS